MGLQLSTYALASVLFLILLGNFVVMSSFDAQGSTGCSSVDCPTSSNNEEGSNDDDTGNIEEQIPSVLPFP
jgi:hypothetical protein